MKKIFFSFLLVISSYSYAQILGGGAAFATSVIFNQTWTTSCPGSGTVLSNQASFEPTTEMVACAPSPACATGTTGSDVWFKFNAQSTTASIVASPNSAFDIAIQAFSGTSCNGLTSIGCIDNGGDNVAEQLNLTGLTVNTLYYFRIFGATNNVSSRTGTYTFCGSAFNNTTLPVILSSFKAVAENSQVILNWTTVSESNSAYFEIEKSSDANQYQPIGRVAGSGTTTQVTQYNFKDIAPFTLTNYYRLKQVDIDGRYQYSTVLSIRPDDKLKKNIRVYPNPVSEKINIRISSDAATNGEIRILNVSGQTIYRQSERLVKGENLVMINSPQNLSKGLYTVQVMMEGNYFSKFIVKVF